MQEKYYPWTQNTRKGVELHLDHLIGAIEDGLVASENGDLDVLRRLSKEVGGYNDAFSTIEKAQTYTARTRMVADRLGQFYESLDAQST